MKFQFLIAIRYLFAKKSQNIINIISAISVLGIATGTIALIIVLSVFNGLHNLVGSLYNNFDPDLKVIPNQGKVFTLNDEMLAKINSLKGVEASCKVLEDNALLKYGSRQMPAILIGVDTSFQKVSNIENVMIDGRFTVKQNEQNRGVIGAVLADQLSLRINFLDPLTIYVPDRTKKVNLTNPTESFTTAYTAITGVFAVNQSSYDSQYLLISIDMAHELFKYPKENVSSLYLKCDASQEDEIKKSIKTLFNDAVTVQNRQEQHQTFYRIMKVEKAMSYLILSFILMIATFNIIGTLSLLIFEKKESILTFRAMGVDRKGITNIFLLEGALITLIGIIGGLFIGSTLILIQQFFGLVKFSGGGSFIVNAYPVELHLFDVTAVLLTVTAISFLSVWYPVRVIVHKYYSNRQE